MEATVLDSHDYRAVPTARTHALSVVAGLECALLGMLSVGMCGTRVRYYPEKWDLVR